MRHNAASQAAAPCTAWYIPEFSGFNDFPFFFITAVRLHAQNRERYLLQGKTLQAGHIVPEFTSDRIGGSIFPDRSAAGRLSVPAQPENGLFFAIFGTRHNDTVYLVKAKKQTLSVTASDRQSYFLPAARRSSHQKGSLKCQCLTCSRMNNAGINFTNTKHLSAARRPSERISPHLYSHAPIFRSAMQSHRMFPFLSLPNPSSVSSGQKKNARSTPGRTMKIWL